MDNNAKLDCLLSMILNKYRFQSLIRVYSCHVYGGKEQPILIGVFRYLVEVFVISSILILMPIVITPDHPQCRSMVRLDSFHKRDKYLHPPLVLRRKWGTFLLIICHFLSSPLRALDIPQVALLGPCLQSLAP